MAGLAAGSTCLGRWVTNPSQAAALYSRVELLAGVTGGLSLLGLAAVSSLYIGVYPHLSGLPILLPLLRFLGVGAVLFIPAFLMGGSLPILIAYTTKSGGDLGTPVARLYWINTLGALAGTLSAGFMLLPALGLRKTVGVAIALNVISGLIAFRIPDSPKPELKPGLSEPHLTNSEHPQERISFFFLLVLFALTGATAFAYEIAWTRLLAVAIGNSTYSFTIILSAFLLGSVVGTILFEWKFASRGRMTTNTLSCLQVLLGVAAIVSLVSFRWSPALIPVLLRLGHHTFGAFLVAQTAIGLLTLLPVAIVFGFNFPAVLAFLDSISKRDAGVAAITGKGCAANTFGAVAGSLVTGFALVPWLGSYKVISVVAVSNLLLALVLDWFSSEASVSSLVLKFSCLAAACFVGWSSLFHDPALLAFSPMLYANTSERHLTVEEIAATNDLLFSAEGVNASVAVVRSDNHVALRVNGKVDASTGDARTQLLAGHLGAAFHAKPRRVLVIGFGSGMTVSALARYPGIERIDCVEIEPMVLGAAPYLASLNRGVLGDPRVNIIFDDARNFLLTASGKYDLIVSEPSNPWIAGVATLFTDEFYSAARARLADGGILVQWIQAYSLATSDLRMVVATLAPHFAETTLWRAEEGDFLLLARSDPKPFRFDRLRSEWGNAGVRKDFESMDIYSPEGLAAYFLLDDAGVRSLAEGADLNTDDRTLLEYRAPKALLRPDLLAENQVAVSQRRAGPLPANLDKPEIPQALEAGLETALELNDATNAQRFLQALESTPPSATRLIAEARLALLRNALAEASASLESALKLAPDSPEALHWMAVVRNREGKPAEARALVDTILKKHPGDLDALTDQMELAAARNDFGIALLAQLGRMKAMADAPAFEYCRLGSIWIKQSNLVEAELAFLQGTLKDPYSYACNLGLGELYRATGRPSMAKQYLEKVIRLFPNADAATYKSLGALYASLGDASSAKTILRKGHRVFPDDAELQKTDLP